MRSQADGDYDHDRLIGLGNMGVFGGKCCGRKPIEIYWGIF